MCLTTLIWFANVLAAVSFGETLGWNFRKRHFPYRSYEINPPQTVAPESQLSAADAVVVLGEQRSLPVQ
jgi:hypothetical protein